MIRLSSAGKAADFDQALQASLDSLRTLGGGTLHLDSGTYLLGGSPSPVHCRDCRDITVIGSRGAILRAGKPVGTLLLFSNSRRIVLKNLRFEGRPLPQEAWGSNEAYHGGVRFTESRQLTVDSCMFRGFFTGALILQSGTRDFTVKDCLFEDVAYRMKGGDFGAISIEAGSGKGLIYRNRFTGAIHSGISAYGSDSLEIYRNRIAFDPRSVYSMGIFALDGIRNSVISRNEIFGVFNEAVVLSSGSGPVSGNRIEHNTLAARFAGVCLNEDRLGCGQEAAIDNVIHGNHISGTTREPVHHAVLLSHAARTSITGNRIIRKRWTFTVINCSSATKDSANVLR